MASSYKIVAAGTADVQAMTTRCKVSGFAWQATVAGVVVLRDGTGTGDPAVITLQMGANAADQKQIPPVVFANGVFVDRDGTVNNTITLFIESGVG